MERLDGPTPRAKEPLPIHDTRHMSVLVPKTTEFLRVRLDFFVLGRVDWIHMLTSRRQWTGARAVSPCAACVPRGEKR